jgi:hypothetical protein
LEEFTDGIDYNGVIEQLQRENEELRVRLTQTMKNTPFNEAIDNVVVFVQKSDPMKLYLWVCIACAILMVFARILEIFIK